MEEGKQHPYNEAGRRLKAAIVSYQLGLAGVDSTLKKTPEIVEDSWAELAEDLLKNIAEGLARRFSRETQGRIQ